MKQLKEVMSHFLLQYHGLLNPQKMSGKDSIITYLNKVKCIQFDPLSICGRNPDLVLQSRIEEYRQEWLQELLYADRKLLDGWDKMMSLYRVEDWPFFTRLRREMKNSYLNRYSEVAPHLAGYLEEVRHRGPLSSLQFTGKSKVNWAWGSSRLAKAALEGLYYGGDLSIHHREHTRRVYDLTERLLPPDILKRPDPNPGLEDYRKAHILRRIRSAGIGGFSSRDFWFGIAQSNMKEIRKDLTDLLDEGQVYKISIPASKRDWFVPGLEWDEFQRRPEEAAQDSRAVLLAPLDNMMWNRELLEDLFDFSYRWEVYTPAEKRQYGYYVLPILYRGRIVGRCEPVIDRKKRSLTLKNLWLEKETHLNETLIHEMRGMFSRFARFLRATRILTAPGLGRNYRKFFSGITVSQ